MAGWSEVFVNVLMNEGIPAYAQTSSGYFDTVEVETILSLLSVLDNPMQDIPLAAVLRSPIVGMTDEEMAWMMAAYKRRAAKDQDRGVYAAWKLWEEARALTAEAASGEDMIRIGKGGIPGRRPGRSGRSLAALERFLKSYGGSPGICPSMSFCTGCTGRAGIMTMCPPCQEARPGGPI